MNNKGFTIVEILITLAIAGLIIASASGFAKGTLDLNRDALKSLNNQLNSRQAMRQMVYELRSAFSILEAGTSTIHFLFDVDDDGLLDDLSYSLDPLQSALYREVDGVSERLVGEVENSSSTPIFEYDGRFIKITLIVGGKSLVSGILVRNLQNDI